MEFNNQTHTYMHRKPGLNTKKQCEKILPAADFKSYGGTVKADCVPSMTFDTVDDITEVNIIIAVVNGGEFSARRGLNTVSIAKKQPATAALKPEGQKREENEREKLNTSLIKKILRKTKAGTIIISDLT